MDPDAFVRSLTDESEAGAVRVLEVRDGAGAVRWSALYRCEGHKIYRQVVAPGFWHAWEAFTPEAAVGRVGRDLKTAEVKA